jgi:hypothetical protein
MPRHTPGCGAAVGRAAVAAASRALPGTYPDVSAQKQKSFEALLAGLLADTADLQEAKALLEPVGEATPGKSVRKRRAEDYRR